MAYPEDDELLDPQQRALLMPQPVQRGPVSSMPGMGMQMPGAGTAVATPVRLTGQAGTRPGEVQVAQSYSGSGPPTAPPPGYSRGGSSAGQFQTKPTGAGVAGNNPTVFTLPPGAQPFIPWQDPASKNWFTFEPRGKQPGFEMKKVEGTPVGPEKPGDRRQDGQVMVRVNKDGIAEPQSIAPNGPPGETFEFKGKLWRRHDDGKKYTEYDPGAERVPVPKEFGMPEGTTMTQKELDALIKQEAEARQNDRRAQDKARQEQDFKEREARTAAATAERMARRNADREVLKAGDKSIQGLGQQKALLEMAEGYLDAGMKTGKWEEASLPLRQWVRSLTGGKSEDIRQLDMQEAFGGFMNQQIQQSRAGGPGDSNFSNADLLFAQGSSPGLGKGVAANRALAARQGQILDWRERQHKALKQFFNANPDKGIEDFDPVEAGVDRAFPTWQRIDNKTYQKLRHGQVYIDGNGQYQEVGADKPKYVMQFMQEDEFKRLPAGTTYLDLNGVPQVKLEEQ